MARRKVLQAATVRRRAAAALTQHRFSCLTSTKVPILTQTALQARSDRSTTRGCCPNAALLYAFYLYKSTNTDAEGAAGKKRPYHIARQLLVP
jgi:hypothetical protein